MSRKERQKKKPDKNIKKKEGNKRNELQLFVSAKAMLLLPLQGRPARERALPIRSLLADRTQLRAASHSAKLLLHPLSAWKLAPCQQWEEQQNPLQSDRDLQPSILLEQTQIQSAALSNQPIHSLDLQPMRNNNKTKPEWKKKERKT
jgi:hypothetical protein